MKVMFLTPSLKAWEFKLLLLITFFFVTILNNKAFAQETSSTFPVLDTHEALIQFEDQEIAVKIMVAKALAEAHFFEIDRGVYKLNDGYASFFVATITQQQWYDQLVVNRVPLGKVLSRILISNEYVTSRLGFPEGEYIVLQYKTNFENKKNVYEIVTMFHEGEGSSEWRLAGYSIK